MREKEVKWKLNTKIARGDGGDETAGKREGKFVGEEALLKDLKKVILLLVYCAG